MAMSPKQLKKWAKTRQMGRARYIWLYGVLGWGLMTGVSWSVAMGAMRRDGKLESIDPIAPFASPRLGIRFEVNGELKILTADGREFKTREERATEFREELRNKELAIEEERIRAMQAEVREKEASARAEAEKARADAEKVRAEEAKALTERERAAKDLLAQRLRELGIDPDELLKSPQ
jgi:hypothetical protein